MVCEAEAVYEDGVLRLSRKIPIRNGAKVRVIVLSTKEDSVDSALRLLERGRFLLVWRPRLLVWIIGPSWRR